MNGCVYSGGCYGGEGGFFMVLSVSDLWNIGIMFFRIFCRSVGLFDGVLWVM